MKQTFFVTGTDTDAGKTLVSAALLNSWSAQGLSTLGIKPIAAGCEMVDDELRNADALALMEQASIELSYSQVNPVALAPAIAPHIAAEQIGSRLSADRISAFCRGTLMRRYDRALIEGAGGWRVPLNDREALSRVAQELGFPVILVVGMKLGCLNHALLTAEAIARDGLRLAGWVANRIDPNMAEFDANLAWLERHLAAPLLGVVPFLETPSAANAATYLDTDKLS